MKSFVFGLAFLILLLGCRNKDSANRQKTQSWQTVSVIRDTLKVTIPIQGKLIAWKKVDILNPVPSRLVSLLVEKGDLVKSGDLILSIWPLKPHNNFSTIDITAPLSGVVRSIYFALNDTMPANKPILTIENRDNLILKTTLSQGELAYVKPDLNVILSHHGKKIKGAVWQVDKKSQRITIVVPNQQNPIKQDLYVKGFIDLGKMQGAFLPVRFFGFADSLKAKIKTDSIITIRKAGYARDSLILIDQNLPGEGKIEIKKILTL